MGKHKGTRVGLRARWVVQGLAIAALCAASGLASAKGHVIIPHERGPQGRLADVALGGSQSSADPQQPVQVPEPGTLALLLAGLAGPLVTRLRARSQDSGADNEAAPGRAD
ncbi:MAG: PEP-CTERM sorting domain-containing protein [Steroidobacteraceae bacterium]